MKVIVVMDVQFWDYVKNHWTVIFKLVNYLNLVAEAATINNGIKNISHLSTAFQVKRSNKKSMHSNHCLKHRENKIKIYYMEKLIIKKKKTCCVESLGLSWWILKRKKNSLLPLEIVKCSWIKWSSSYQAVCLFPWVHKHDVTSQSVLGCAVGCWWLLKTPDPSISNLLILYDKEYRPFRCWKNKEWV